MDSRLYVTSSNKGSGAVTVYFIDRSNGTLQAVPNGSLSISGYPDAVVVHPSGDFVFVATTNGSNFQTDLIYAFKVNRNGSLTPVSGSPY